MLPPYFIVLRRGAVVWRGFCCCEHHANGRAGLAHPHLVGSVVQVVALEPGHPLRREAAA